MRMPNELISGLQTAWPKNRTHHFVFHGHSVPAGYHKTPDVRPFESYPLMTLVRLKAEYPNAVINVITTAIGGENCLAGAKRFAADVLRHAPDVIFIDYALNDRRVPIEQCEAAWRSMIDAAGDIPVVLLTPTGDARANYDDPADPLVVRAELIRKIAADKNVPLADVFAAWTAALRGGTDQSMLLSRVNHPNAAGHALASKVIADLFVSKQ